MLIKKITSLLLVASFMSIMTAPLNASTIQSDNESLADFLKATDRVDASYTYPSMRIASNAVGKVELAAHTPIVIKCNETITTNDIVSGGTVSFSVVNDVVSSTGKVLIKAGAPVSAVISFSKNSGVLGRSGELTISDFHTVAVDGTYIPLSGSVSSRPDDKMTLSIVLGVLICPLFLLMKGEEARLSAGAQKTAYTVTNVYIKPAR